MIMEADGAQLRWKNIITAFVEGRKTRREHIIILAT
jgi:hypothetical protein